MDRQRYVFGNWKMNKTVREAVDYFSVFSSLIREASPIVTVGICPAFTSLSSCRSLIDENDLPIWLGAQNVHQASSGAFTGEISAGMLQEFNVNFVLAGHSECRHIFHEQDSDIAEKVVAISRSGMVPVLCIGETLEVRERQATQDYLANQLVLGLSQLPKTEPVIIAYEPVWAIGTGRVASTSDVQEVHAFCRDVLSNIFSHEKSKKISILYGGSVKPENAEGFAHCPDVDGLLVGGASLDPKVFVDTIVQFDFPN
ncbi:triose-phosphate isomerase [Chlamydia ibidis]|uniref:Triosephosphate isomerase n=2 Tax=Chlamydia ibidis TaxID=1405396 RepID=S7KDV2_9CHLA|nr:triose-phosphate isomerase [Chlamydia ibidis]EPP34376.1 triose-phosphate isomerase [Chlamydia ibidis]EQM62918.1 triose-phosphate isomerase [Chlamydia ibidis 10-1398/6]